MKLNKKSELRKMALNYRKENLVMRAKLVKVTDITKAYEEAGRNPGKYLKEIIKVVREVNEE